MREVGLSLVDCAQGFASGKVVLLGEHGVVHGGMGVVMPVPLWSRVILKRAAKIPEGLVGHVARVFFDFFHLAPFGFQARFLSSVPSKRGFGSSAACVVSVLRALESLSGRSLQVRELFVLAKQCEDALHGTSSGIDVAAVLSSGPIVFCRGQWQEVVLDLHSVQFFDTGVAQSMTQECVSHTSKKWDQDRSWVVKISDCVQAFVEGSKRNDQEHMRQAVRANHKILSALGVVPEWIQEIVQQVERVGGAGKICGAGSLGNQGAGVLMLMHPLPPRIALELNSRCDFFFDGREIFERLKAGD